MKTGQIIAIVVVVLAVIGGIIFVTRDTGQNKNTNTLSESENANKSDSENQDNSNSTANVNTNTADAGPCTRNVNKKLMQDQIDIKNKFVTLEIENFGKIKIQLYDQDAPKTVENFLRLTKSGYYDCLTFHRIAKDFVIQGGDPTGNGSGGESAFGGQFADELNPNTPSGKAGYKKGVVAMANRGPNTNTSQFFIMLDDVPLPYSYTIFGKVVAGQDVVDKIGGVPINPQMGPTDGSPKEKITITKATISDN